jgi:uncharacterized protein YecE (DUF72 family)
MRGTGALRLGTSGWQYDHWRGVLYPEGLARARWLGSYAERFDTVEVDSTFYGLPAREVFERWRAAVPPGFVFALKLSRFVTHRRRLARPEEPVARFFSRADGLAEKLGPLLVQLPPRLQPDVPRLSALLECVPPGRQVAVELRDPRWLIEPVFDALRGRGAALVLHDAIARHPRLVTAPFTYLRLHGGAGHGGAYSVSALSGWARWIRARLDEGLTVHAYFNNDLGGHAVRDALRLRRRLERWSSRP